MIPTQTTGAQRPSLDATRSELLGGRSALPAGAGATFEALLQQWGRGETTVREPQDGDTERSPGTDRAGEPSTREPRSTRANERVASSEPRTRGSRAKDTERSDRVDEGNEADEKDDAKAGEVDPSELLSLLATLEEVPAPREVEPLVVEEPVAASSEAKDAAAPVEVQDASATNAAPDELGSEFEIEVAPLEESATAPVAQESGEETSSLLVDDVELATERSSVRELEVGTKRDAAEAVPSNEASEEEVATSAASARPSVETKSPEAAEASLGKGTGAPVAQEPGRADDDRRPVEGASEGRPRNSKEVARSDEDQRGDDVGRESLAAVADSPQASSTGARRDRRGDEEEGESLEFDAESAGLEALPEAEMFDEAPALPVLSSSVEQSPVLGEEAFAAATTAPRSGERATSTPRDPVDLATAPSELSPSREVSAPADLGIANPAVHKSSEASAPVASTDAVRALARDNAARFRELVEENFRARSARDHWQLELELRPRELGTIHIQFEVKGDQLVGRMQFEDRRLEPEMREVLDELERELADWYGGDARFERGDEDEWGGRPAAAAPAREGRREGRTSTASAALPSGHTVDFLA